MLGLIIEAASGESYADYIQEHIFTPLNMSHTYTSKSTAQQNGLAMGHRYWFGIPIRRAQYAYSARFASIGLNSSPVPKTWPTT